MRLLCWLGFGWVQSIVIAGVMTGVFLGVFHTRLLLNHAEVTNNAGFTFAPPDIWDCGRFLEIRA